MNKDNSAVAIIDMLLKRNKFLLEALLKIAEKSSAHKEIEIIAVEAIEENAKHCIEEWPKIVKKMEFYLKPEWN